MVQYLTALAALCAAALGSISIRRAGWLDRVVAYHKQRFFDDLKKFPLVQIKATIERAPPGYTDSQDWDYDSVVRLLSLLRDSDGAKTVRRALRRSMQSNRRFMSYAQSLKAFPSLAKEEDNNFYYDVDSSEYNADVGKKDGHSRLDDEDVIVVSNPVEARLPSASISVKLLKSILENRAKAGRHLTTKKKNIPWSSMILEEVPKASKSTARTAASKATAESAPESPSGTTSGTKPETTTLGPSSNLTDANATQANSSNVEAPSSNSTL